MTPGNHVALAAACVPCEPPWGLPSAAEFELAALRTHVAALRMMLTTATEIVEDLERGPDKKQAENRRHHYDWSQLRGCYVCRRCDHRTTEFWQADRTAENCPGTDRSHTFSLRPGEARYQCAECGLRITPERFESGDHLGSCPGPYRGDQ